jgi:hypothetical protein
LCDPPKTLATTTKARWPFGVRNLAATEHRPKRAAEAGFASLSNCLLQRRETRTTQKEKNETDFIKE